MALNLELNSERYVQLLEKLIGETEFLQNNPPRFVPQEDRAVKHVLEALKPYLLENGGVIKAEHVTFVEGRGNLLLEYCPEGAAGTVTFIGSHLDVVPANPETWERNPFQLKVEGDKLYGRGTTDCLGHVALVTELFIQLAEKKPALKFSVHAVFIASEENSSIPGVGVEKLLEVGKLEKLKNGPLFWVDSADSQPCMGTATAMMWTLRVEGRLFHSGLPHKGINSLELAMEAMAHIQSNFYKDYPAHPEEERYKFATPSTMKPTQIRCSEGSVNQLPPWTEIQGDIRLTPFYDAEACLEKVMGYVASLNSDLSQLPTRGPCSKYELDIAEGKFKGELTFTLEGGILRGIACNLDSVGFQRLDEATRDVMGESKPYSICGSLPLVGDLQRAGFDVQVCGYGHSSVYHGDNEYCSLSMMKNALKILSCLLDKFN
jgi:acetylornithine deacetylase